MQNIINLLNTSSFSGAENVACQIVKLSNESGYNSYYVSPKGSIENILKEKHVKTIMIDKLSFFEILKIVKENNIDIIHAHDFRATFYAVLVSVFRGTKVVAHIHSDFDMMAKISIYSVIFYMSTFLVKNIVWVSDNAMKRFRFYNAIKNKSIVINNVVDTKEIQRKIYEDKKTYDFDLIYIGRLSEEKNVLRLLKIFNSCLKHRDDLKLGIIGSGVTENDIKQYIVEHNMSNNVELLGFRSNPYKALSSSKMLVLTSLNEGLPMCILESFSCGVPVVSTAVGNIPNVIVNDYNGYCYLDDKSLIESILNIMNNPTKQKILSENAKKYMEEKFSEKDFAKAILDIYNRL